MSKLRRKPFSKTVSRLEAEQASFAKKILICPEGITLTPEAQEAIKKNLYGKLR